MRALRLASAAVRGILPLICLWGSAVLLGAPAARAQAGPGTADTLFERGNQAYLHGDYAGAASAYEELLHQGAVSADLYFNLGDAYFRMGSLGPAIWAFEKAAALNPGSEDARYNLAEARKVAARQAHDRIEGEDRDPLWIRAVTALGPSAETWLFVAMYLGFRHMGAGLAALREG